MRCPRCNGTGEIEATIGDILRERREATGLSQEKLAQRAGVSRTLVTMIETSRGNPSMHTLNALLGALGCELRIEKVNMAVPNNGVQPTAELAGSQPITADPAIERQPAAADA